MKVQRRNITRN